MLVVGSTRSSLLPNKHCSLRLYGNIILQAASIPFIRRSVESVRVVVSYYTYVLILPHSLNTLTGREKLRKEIINVVLILSETMLCANIYKYGRGINA